MNKKRVVITGLGVVAPNGVGVSNFTKALKNGTSGITFHQELKDLNFSCQIGGIPQISDELKSKYFTDLQLRGFNSSGILYGCIAGIDAWKDAGFNVDNNSPLDYDTGLETTEDVRLKFIPNISRFNQLKLNKM